MGFLGPLFSDQPEFIAKMDWVFRFSSVICGPTNWLSTEIIVPGSINSVHKKSVQDGMQQWVSLLVQHFWHDTRLMVSVLQCFWSRAAAAS